MQEYEKLQDAYDALSNTSILGNHSLKLIATPNSPTNKSNLENRKKSLF